MIQAAGTQRSIDLDSAAGRVWDVLVVGAGPAGAMAAYQLACNGLTVLIVDKNSPPRSKVCGCCMNGAALAALRVAGLGDLPRSLGAQRLREVHLHVNKHSASLPLPVGVALSREAFDAAL